MKPAEFRLLYAGKSLDDNQKSLSDYKIQNKSVLYLVPKKMNMKVKDKSKLIVTIKAGDNSKIEVVYEEIRDKLVKEVLEEYTDNPKSHFSLIFGQKIIRPHEKISQIEESIEVDKGGITLLILKTEKYFFSRSLKEGVVFPKNLFPLEENSEKLRK